MANVTDTYYANDTDIGYGSQLLVGQGDGSPETFVAVYGVVSIKLGKLTNEKIRRTHLRSIGRAHEYTTGLADYEAIQVRVNWNPSHGSQSAAGLIDGFTGVGLLGLQISQATTNFKAVIPIGGAPFEWPFSGKVMSFDPPEINNEGLLEATFEIQPVSDYRGELP